MFTQKWYYFFIALTVLSLVDILSISFIKPYTSSGLGLISLIISYPTIIIFGNPTGGSISTLIIMVSRMVLAFWPIWAGVAYMIRRQLKGKKEPGKPKS